MAQLKKVPTACAVCGSCCEVEACVEDGRLVSIEGAKCAKGVAGAQFEYNPERILYPMKRTGKKRGREICPDQLGRGLSDHC